MRHHARLIIHFTERREYFIITSLFVNLDTLLMRLKLSILFILAIFLSSCEKDEPLSRTYVDKWIGSYSGYSDVDIYPFGGTPTLSIADCSIEAKKSTVVNAIDFTMNIDGYKPLTIDALPIDADGKGSGNYEENNNYISYTVEFNGRALEIYYKIVNGGGFIDLRMKVAKTN